MAVCRMNWPYRRTLRFLDRSTMEPIDQAGFAYRAFVRDAVTAAQLALWTTTTGFLYPAAGGRCVIDIPGSAMMAPLRPGIHAFELQRTDDGSNAIIGAFMLQVLAADQLPTSFDSSTDLTVITEQADITVQVEVGIPGRDGVGNTGDARWGRVLGYLPDQLDLNQELLSKAPVAHPTNVTDVSDPGDITLLFENRLI